ncbi:MAG: hypothetical protein AAGH15_11225 [Myxococcota bacterium]
MDGRGKGATLGGRLRAARARGLVGRGAEVARFEAVLGAPEPRLLWVHGVGGVGKSTLVRRWVELARARGLAAATVDLQLVEGSPEGIEAELATAFGVRAEGLAEHLLDAPRVVLFFDTWEHGASCEAWMREAFLPALPAESVVVFASRRAPGVTWRTDPGFRELLLELPLANLDDESAARFLATEDVPEDRREALVALTRGHPLALTLAAEVARDAGSARLEESPRLLSALMDRFVASVPSEAHRAALRLTAHARFTDETLLRDVVGGDVSALFDWLRALPFVTGSARGLVPHALARDVIDADFRWRDREGYGALHRRLGRVLLDRIEGPEPAALEAFFDFLYLFRPDPRLHEAMDFDQLGTGWVDVPPPDEHAALVDRARALYPDNPGAQILAHWLARRPEDVRVFRDHRGVARLVTLHTTLDAFEAEDRTADPSLATVADWVDAQGGLEPGKRVVLSTQIFTDPAISPLLKLRHHWSLYATIRTPDVAFATILCSAGFRRFAAAHGVVAELPVELAMTGPALGFVADLRSVPRRGWSEALLDRVLGEESPDGRPVPAGLPPGAIEAAVRAALRLYNREDELEVTQLASTACIQTGAFPSVKALLDAALESLDGHPKDRKLLRALHAAYVRPAPTREAAAERVGVPFSTYRRHLKKGTERVAAWIVRREQR